MSLLLLFNQPSGPTSALLRTQVGLTAIGGPQATLGVTIGESTPSSVELNIFANSNVAIGLTGVSVGFFSGSANLDNTVSLFAFPGFGAVPALAIHIGLTGTVGSFIQSAAAMPLSIGLTGHGNMLVAGPFSVSIGLSAAVTISGGTVAPTSNLSLTTTLNGAAVALSDLSLSLTTQVGLVGAAEITEPGLATGMRLSFGADQIRTFFRKG